MQLPIYLDFNDFQNNFKIDFVQISNNSKKIKLVEYYEMLQTRYENLLINYKNIIVDLQYLKNEIGKRKIEQLSNDNQGNNSDLGTAKLLLQIQQFNDTYKLPIEVTILGNNTTQLLNFINNSIKEVERIIKLLSFEIRKQPNQFVTDESEPLTQKGIEKIGLFVRSGIINFLKEKNPNITNTQLSKFLRELTSEYLENSESTRPHLTTNINSDKHPFYANGRLNELDLILSKYGIKPQTDN